MRLLSLILFLCGVLLAAVWLVPPRLALAPEPQAAARLLAPYVAGEVAVHGEVSLHFLPRPHLRMGDVRLVSPSLVANIDELRGHLSWSQLWGGANAWQIMSAQLLGGAVQMNKTPTSINAMREIIFSFALDEISLTDVDMEIIEAADAPPLVLPSLSAQMQRSNNNDYYFRITQGDIILSATIESANAVRAPIEITIARRDNSERLSLSGALQQEPSFQIDAEAVFISRHFLRGVLRRADINLARTVDSNLYLSGFATITPLGVRAENMSLEAFGEQATARFNLDWGAAPLKFNVRLSGNALDFTPLSTPASRRVLLAPPPLNPAPQLSFLENIYQHYFKNAEGVLQLETYQFTLGGEAGRNLVSTLAIENTRWRVERFSADLPYQSSAIVVGDFTNPLTAPQFDGRFSLRSSDTPSFTLWLSRLFAVDISDFIAGTDDLLREGGLQRVGIASDIKWSGEQGLRLRDLRGHLGDAAFATDIDINALNPLRGDVRVNLQSVNLYDWGLVGDNASPLWFRELSVERRLLAILSLLPPAAKLNMSFDIENLLNAQNNFGATQVALEFSNQTDGQIINIEKIHIADYLGADISLGGSLSLEEARLYGELQIAASAAQGGAFAAPLLPRVPFVDWQAELPLTATATWRLPKPTSEDWTNQFIGAAKLGTMQVDFNLRSPSRDFDFTLPDTSLDLRTKASANELASLLGLPAAYKKQSQASLTITSRTQAANLATLNLQLDIADDAFTFAGVLRPSGEYRLEGITTARQTAANSLLAQMDYGGNAQTTITPTAINFFNLDMRLQNSNISGEGNFANNTLAANILVQDFDATPFLPQYKKKISNRPLQWQFLSAINGNIELRLQRLKFWDYTADTLSSTIKWSDGVLEAPITAALWGGQITLALEAQGGGLTPSFNLRGDYDNLSSAAIIAPLYGEAFMDAGISGGVEISGRGAGVADMVASLVGKVSLTAGEGRLALGADTAPIDFARGLAVVDIGGGQVGTQAADFVILPALSLLKEQTEASFRGLWDIASRQLAASLTTPELDLIFSGDIAEPQIEKTIKELIEQTPPQ